MSPSIGICIGALKLGRLKAVDFPSAMRSYLYGAAELRWCTWSIQWVVRFLLIAAVHRRRKNLFKYALTLRRSKL